MDSGPFNAVLQGIRRLASAEAASGLSDGELLQRFLANRDEDAFATLMHRHGRMVWAVCQRVLHHRHNAEDVFQATFLTLARKANSIRKQSSVASWLHGVAYRLARRLEAELIRQRTGAGNPASQPAGDPVEQVSGKEMQSVLDEELAALSARFRRPLVLCFLEGKTRDEAAASLGWSLSTFKRRLERGRQLLAARLRHRGFPLGVALVGAVVAGKSVWAAGPPSLFNSTCNAAAQVAAGKATAAVVSARVATLTEGMVKAMMLARLKLAASVVLAVLLLAGGAGLWTVHQMQAGETPTQTKPADKPAEADKSAALVKRGEYLVNQVARCGECHTPRDGRGGLDMSRHLQGAAIWFTPKSKVKGEWEDRAPDITAGGRGGKWSESKLTKFLMTGKDDEGEAPEAPMPAYKLSEEDARAVTAYLRSLPGKKQDGEKKKDTKKQDDEKDGEKKKDGKKKNDDEKDTKKKDTKKDDDEKDDEKKDTKKDDDEKKKDDKKREDRKKERRERDDD
jgi:RNA polymerase sigma factor (sigma-70 family)